MKTSNSARASFSKRFGSFLSRNQRQIIGGVIFIIGLLFGFGFNSLAVITDLNGASFWGDSQDAVAFDHNKPTQAEMIKIRCPSCWLLEKKER